MALTPMSRNSLYPSTSTEAPARLKTYARLPGDVAGEGRSSSRSRGPSGRWADAILKTTSRGAASASMPTEPVLQSTHKSLSQDCSQTASAVTGSLRTPPCERKSEPVISSLHHHDTLHRTISVSPDTAAPRAIAVAVHPPLSRGSKRFVSAAASAPASFPSATTSVASHASTSNTAAAPATLVSEHFSNQIALPLPLPVGMAGRTGRNRASTVSTVLQNGVNPPHTTVGISGTRSTRVDTPVHMSPQKLHAVPHISRGEGKSSSGNGGSGSASPLACIETHHAFAAAYASSPFFQRVTDAASTPQSSPDAPRPAASTASAIAEDKNNSLLQLQDVTPIPNAGDSQQGFQLLGQPRATAESGGESGQDSYRRDTANEDGSAGATPAVFSSPANAAPLQRSPFTGADNAFVAGGTPPWGMLPYVQSTPYPIGRALPHEQPVLFHRECNGNQDVAAKPFSRAASPSYTAQLSDTPGGLSTLPNGNMYSTGQRRNCSAVSRTATNSTVMSSAYPLTSPGSVSGHFSGIYASTPSSSSQAYANGRDQCSSRLTPGSSTQSCQKVVTSDSAPSAYAHVPNQQHLFLQKYYVDEVSGYDTHGSSLPSSNLTVPASACAAATAVVAAGQGLRSVSASASTAQVAAGGGSDFQCIARGLPGVTLEKQLLYASKGELAQLLLELASCNPDASRFIHSKAFFFVFRHEHRGEAVETCETCLEETPVMTAAAAAVNQNRQHYAADDGLGGGFTSKTAGIPNGDRSCEQSGVLKPPVTGTATHDHVIARCIFPVEAADDEDGDGDDSLTKIEHCDPTVTKGSAHATMPRRCLSAKDRRFSAELHPCLRWYGACRNATSCVYTTVPRNVCLRWILGSCSAGSECSGVHRLPFSCSPEVRRIYELNHGLARRDTPANMCASGVSLGHLLPIPPPFPACTLQARAPSANGSVAAASPTNLNENAPTPELSETCAGANKALGMRAAVMEGLEEKGVVHTPTDQPIQKDTFLRAGSTPHRHSQGRCVELCIPSMRMSEGCGSTPARTNGDTLLSDFSDAAITANACGPVDHEMPQYTGGVLFPGASATAASAAAPKRLGEAGVSSGSRMSGRVSSAGNSRCSTAEGFDSRTNSVSRYLGPQFDRAATAVPHCDDGRPANVAMGWAMQEPQPNPRKIIKSICGSVCDANDSLHVVPICPTGGSEGALIDVDDECDFSAPAAGTRTRMQSPMFQ
ncbi:glucoamylase-like protein [Leishmania tarentolae]|uniref:Glucoamylase-like protein n=1 Tax=Leishmania tarentolae TaxID=5689 RepID=A0A640KG55_LEITA|nr:glucoamylase-like protein [Leishmania tarentolae]